MEVNVVEFSTFYKVEKIPNVDYQPLLNALSTYNNYTREYYPYGYFEFPNHFRCCKLPEKLLRTYLKYCGLKAIIHKSDNFSYDILKEYTMVNKPKDQIQTDVINKALKILEYEERVIISLQTGQGKTYVATNILSNLRIRCIVLVKSNELKRQWVSSFLTHTTLKGNDIYTIDTGEDWFALKENDLINPYVIIATHRSLQLFIDKIGVVEFTKFLLQLKIGCKICDEFDLENASMFRFDTTASLRYNIYLSATTFKSDRRDNIVFQRIFADVEDIGKEHYVIVERKGLFVIFQSNPNERLANSVMKWTPDGFVLDYQKYHSYVIERKTYEKPLKKIWDDILKEKYYSSKLKTVFFIGRKGDLAIKFRDDLAKIFNINKDEIYILNADTPKKERIYIMESARLIVSTSKSMGRGIDLKGLDIIVDLETRASESEMTQVIGRVSRSGMKNVGTYIWLIDYSFNTVRRNYENKVNNGFFDDKLTSSDEWVVGDVKIALKDDELPGKRLIISGSREIVDYDFVKSKLNEIIEENNIEIKEIISGTAKGVDTLGERYAKEKGIHVERFPADWNKYGKRAGYIRNTEMAKYGDIAIIFWDGKSPGTKMMISAMKYYKKKYYLVEV